MLGVLSDWEALEHPCSVWIHKIKINKNALIIIIFSVIVVFYQIPPMVRAWCNAMSIVNYCHVYIP